MSVSQYKIVNGAWPDGPLPELTGPEALKAARILIRVAGHHKPGRKFKLTSGNRYSWTRRGVFYINPDKGWPGLVHDLSHWAHRRTYPDRRPHDGTHVVMERRLIDAVRERGWLDGVLKAAPRPAKAKPDVRAVRYQRVILKLQAWRTKAKRAKTAIAKLEKQRRYYERVIGGPAPG